MSDAPVIWVTPDERDVSDEAIAALVERDASIYQRGNGLVRVGVDDEDGAPHIAALPEATLREALAATVNWRTIVKSKDGPEEKRLHPPSWAVKAVAARGQWPGMRVLRAVVESPILRRDGTVIDAPGYDAATRVYYHPTGAIPAVPARPTHDDAVKAVATLKEPFEDFPYETPAHRSAMLAVVLTPFARYAFDGNTPLVTFDGNIRGVGKSLQADVAAIIFTGHPMPRRAYVDDEAEMKKTVTSIAAGGQWGVLLDNVSGSLGGAALDMALTGEKIEDRLFGRNDVTLRFRCSTLWMASGNNLQLHGDLVRRTLPIRLLFQGTSPEARVDLKHTPLLSWVRERRGALVSAALTILRAYCVAERPSSLSSWGSYEAWSSLVRGAIVWAGEPDPAGARVELSDTAAEIGVRLVDGWREAYPDSAATLADAIELLNRLENVARFEALRSALTDLAGCSLRQVNTVSLAKRMARYRDRVVGAHILRKLPKAEHGVSWQVNAVQRVKAEERKATVDADDADDADGILAGAEIEPRVRAHAGDIDTVSTVSTVRNTDLPSGILDPNSGNGGIEPLPAWADFDKRPPIQ